MSRFLLLFALLGAAPAFADAPPGQPGPSIHVEPTEGTTLSKKDDEAVRKTLGDYLAALGRKEYAKAGDLLDRASLLATVDPMTKAIASDSSHYAAARRRIFGVSTRDSIEARSNGELFAALMGYLLEVDPSAGNVLQHATIEVLATRQMKGKASVAYQLTLPATEPGGMPYEQVTAQQLRKVDGKWRILFSLDR